MVMLGLAYLVLAGLTGIQTSGKGKQIIQGADIEQFLLHAKITEPLLKEHLGKYLSPYQIQGLLTRRDAILALSRQLAAEKGAGAVLYQ
jgi:hypothetical protein